MRREEKRILGLPVTIFNFWNCSLDEPICVNVTSVIRMDEV
jgi:hypothetical protein